MTASISLILTGCLFSALWASAFIAGKAAMVFCDPLSLLCARFAVAGLAMAVWTAAWRGPGVFARRDLLVDGAILGTLNHALYLGLSFAGLETVSAAMTVLIVSTAPFLTAALSVASGGPRSIAQAAGSIVGFAGVYVVLSSRLPGDGAMAIGLGLIFLGTLAFSLGTVVYRARATHHDAVALNGVQNLVGALLLLPFAPEPLAPYLAMSDPGFLLPFAHLTIAVSIAGFLIWLALVREIGAAHASSFHLLNPVFGLMFSAAVFGTAVTATDLLGTAIVIVGLAIVIRDSIGRSTERRVP